MGRWKVGREERREKNEVGKEGRKEGREKRIK